MAWQVPDNGQATVGHGAEVSWLGQMPGVERSQPSHVPSMPVLGLAKCRALPGLG